MNQKTSNFGYSDGNVDTNRSDNPSLEMIVRDRFSRRQTMLGGLRASALALFGTTILAACDDETVRAAAPVVSAGQSATTTAGQLVTLQGTADASAVSSGWTQDGGPQVELVGDGDTVTFVAPGVAEATEFSFVFSGTNSDHVSANATTKVTVEPAVLGFAAVAKNLDDIVTVPAGYSVTVMTRLGDPLAAGVSTYANDGSDSNFAQRIGDHGDALHFFGLGMDGARDESNSTRGLLVQNHENLNIQYLHPNGPTTTGTGARPAAEVVKEIEAHGVSVTEYLDGGDRSWSYVQDSAFNRRITPMTPMDLHGPVSGSNLMVTAYSNAGTKARGTINNCANGHTGWGTGLTCEENWAGYFLRSGDDAQRTAKELTALGRYGVSSSSGNYGWSSVESNDDMFRKWDARATAASAAADYRNEPNQYGWVVELDPYDPSAAPRKRTALGRMGHEGAWLGKLVAGQKVAVYMGDDSRGEYLYKFVSDESWDDADADATDRLAVGDKYLDAGTLYAAHFNADGSGEWLPLVYGEVPDLPDYAFADQADVLVHARLAADAAGATPMDRPEWTAVNPESGEVYLTLTNSNSSYRPLDGTDAANPRHYGAVKGSSTSYGNANGHIIRLAESGEDTAATSFEWDIFLFGADSVDADPMNVNISGLDATNDFSSPDGLWFSRSQNPAGQGTPLLWIQTDDGALTDRTNNQMLAALPGSVGDGGPKTITNVGASGTATQSTVVGAGATDAMLKRFLTGPLECELTGVDTTPDGRTIFVGIQHPGENGEPDAPSSNWPQSQGGTASGRPRSAVIAITKDDGGIIGL